MFYPYNDYMIRAMVKQKQQAFFREAEIDRLLCEMNPRQQGWLSRQTSRLLHRLARLLPAFGKRLDRLEVPRVALTQH